MTISHVSWKKVEVQGNQDDDGTRSVTLTPINKSGNTHRGFTIAAEDAYALAVALNQAADFALSKGEPAKIIPVVLTITAETAPDLRDLRDNPFTSGAHYPGSRVFKKGPATFKA